MFAKDATFANFHENIESFQCNCWSAYESVSRDLESCIFFVKKILWGPRRPNIRNFCYVPWAMTHYILRPTFFWAHPTPPICLCLETQKCAIFSTFWVSGGKNHPKVEVCREKFNIGKFPHIFLWPSIYVGTMSFHFRNIFQ